MGCANSLPVKTYIKIKEIGNKNNNNFQTFLIRSEETKKEYAYKVININAIDKKEKKKLINNWDVLKKINHPNIINLKYADYSENKRIIYEISEYVDGGDLQAKLKEKKEKKESFDENTLSEWFTQICFALKYLHDEKNIFHRDIRPSNIFLNSENIAKLGNFGVAKVLKRGLRYTKTIVSTPQYSAPEIINGKEYSNKADIWSLGLTFYELIILDYPFEGSSDIEKQKNILEGNTKPIPEDCQIDQQFIDIINQMLSKREDERPSAEEILEKGIIKSRMQSYLLGKNYDKSTAENLINEYEKNKKTEKKKIKIQIEEDNGEILEFNEGDIIEREREDEIKKINDKMKSEKGRYDLNKQMTIMSDFLKKSKTFPSNDTNNNN